MRVRLALSYCIVERDESDRKYPETWRGESLFFYHVKQKLLAGGYDVIKKQMAKDGHLVGDCYYIRERNWAWCLFDPNYQIRLTTEQFNTVGAVKLEKASLL